MKKLAIALCIISTQAFGMESKTEKPIPAFRNLAQLQKHLVDELRKGTLKPSEFNFALSILSDANHRIKCEKARKPPHDFQAVLKREDAFFKRLEQNAIKCIIKAIAKKTKKK